MVRIITKFLITRREIDFFVLNNVKN